MFRHQFRAQIKSESGSKVIESINDCKQEVEEVLRNYTVTFLRLYQFEDQLFTYLEARSFLPDFNLPATLSEYLVDCPGNIDARKFVSMLDIFHDAIPRPESTWRSDLSSRESAGSIVYLRPEKYCSYVFYHFQLQEEGVRKFNKYYLIGAHENCLFSYQESPAEIEMTNHDRVLNTTNSPENWGELMAEHFKPWHANRDDGESWKKMTENFSYSAVSKSEL